MYEAEISALQSAKNKIGAALSGWASPWTDEKTDLNSAISALNHFGNANPVVSQARADLQGATTYLSLSPPNPTSAKTKVFSARDRVQQQLDYYIYLQDISPG